MREMGLERCKASVEFYCQLLLHFGTLLPKAEGKKSELPNPLDDRKSILIIKKSWCVNWIILGRGLADVDFVVRY